MSQVVENGTGTRARLDDRLVAGKTGTTPAARDAWFVGFTADYVAGVWMGYDDNTPLEGVTGGGWPAEFWREVMMRVHDGLPVRELPMIVPTPRARPDETPGLGEFQTSSPSPSLGQPGGAGQPQNPVDDLLRDLLGETR